VYCFKPEDRLRELVAKLTEEDRIGRSVWDREKGEGWSPLHSAASRGHVSAIEILVQEAKADKFHCSSIVSGFL
jgi:hypothetical protein